MTAPRSLTRKRSDLFFVYVDRTDAGEVFYVGKGNYWRVLDPRRNKKHRRVAARCGFNREIVWETPDDRAACAFEQQLIEFFGTYTTDWSDLTIACNFTLGGDGMRMPGHRCDVATRQKISAALKGKAKSTTHCLAMSARRQGRKLSDAHRRGIAAALNGRSLSEEHRRKLREAALKRYAK